MNTICNKISYILLSGAVFSVFEKYLNCPGFYIQIFNYLLSQGSRK